MLFSSTLLAQTSGKSGKSKSEAKNTYTYEVAGTIHYSTAKGAVRASGEESDTRLSETNVGSTMMIGWIASDHIEPFLEGTYRRVKRRVDKFTTNESIMDTGFGLLINLPQVSKTSKTEGSESDGTDSEIMQAGWIPYVGILLGTSRNTDNRGTGGADQSNLSESDSYTKFLLGTRWMVFPNISLNFSARILYERSSSEAKSVGTNGAQRSKMEMEINLLSMSMFL